MKVISCIIILLLMVLNSGCCSYMVYKNSERNVAYRRAVASGNEEAIRAVASGDNNAIKAVRLKDGGVAIGLDVAALDALKENPVGQIVAAIIDALSAWGVKEVVDYYKDKKDDEEEKDTGNSNNSTVNVTVQDNNESDVDVDVYVDTSEKKDTTSNDRH